MIGDQENAPAQSGSGRRLVGLSWPQLPPPPRALPDGPGMIFDLAEPVGVGMSSAAASRACSGIELILRVVRQASGLPPPGERFLRSVGPQVRQQHLSLCPADDLACSGE